MLITLCALYWGGVLFFALAQFWVICSPSGPVPCPTLLESTLRACGIVLAGGAVFGVAVWLVNRLFL